MGFYDNKILPVIIDKACSMASIMDLRKKVVPLARGVVLEVGMGSGINLALYEPDNIDFVWGLEPSEGMRKKAQRNLEKSSIEVKWLDLRGEDIPLDSNSVDTVLLTYTLCTIPDWQRALEQMHRVLKPNGKLLFCEHGLAETSAVQNWQHVTRESRIRRNQESGGRSGERKSHHSHGCACRSPVFPRSVEDRHAVARPTTPPPMTR